MKEEIRKLFLKLGADVCGISNIDRFTGAPPGFHPRDIYPDCRSVIVFGVGLPKGLYAVSPRIIYNHYCSISKIELDRIAYHASMEIEQKPGCIAVPVPSDAPYDEWDAQTLSGRAVLSMRHAAVLAGLGALGKSALLLNRKFGNLIDIGAVLTNIDLPSDPLAESICLEGCRLCLDSCPTGALDGTGANQQRCRPHTYVKNERGFDVTTCNACRSVCPMRFGVEK